MNIEETDKDIQMTRHKIHMVPSDVIEKILDVFRTYESVIMTKGSMTVAEELIYEKIKEAKLEINKYTR